MQKPRLTFWQIWNMSFGFFGIQFGFALQNANVSRIFETLGAKIDDIAILWIAAPVTGLVVQPIIGYLSDRTWNALGRRRPFFLIGSVLATLSLFVMPNSPSLLIAAMMLWVMDASINISMEPFRALVADLLPTEQRTTGFVVQSFFIGLGAVIASALPYMFTNWFGVPAEDVAGTIPASVEYSFYAGGFVYFIAVMYTIVTTKEYPPDDIEAFEAAKKEKSGFLHGINEVFQSLITMPRTMSQLAVVQFFSWFALFSMWIYTTPAVTKNVFNALPTDADQTAYVAGGDWVGVLFAVYNGVAALVAFLIPVIAKYIGRKRAHAVCLLMGGIGLLSIFFIRDQYMLLLSMVGVGLAWASILSMPYAILAGALPSNKMGFYMGVFNFFIVLPQITAAAILGFILKYVFGSEAVYALVLGGVAMMLAAVTSAFFVDDVDDIVK